MPPKRRKAISPTPPESLATPAIQVAPETTTPRVLSKRHRTDLPLSRKAELIRDYQEALAKKYTITNTSLSRKYGISPGAAARIIKDKDSILKRVEESPSGSKERKRLYKRNMQPVEEALFCWFLKQRKYGINIDEKTLRGQALVIWTEMKPLFRPESAPKDCAFSSGWCTGFKNDRGIKFRAGHGESGSVDLEAVQGRIDEIKRLLQTFELDDIYNCDETGLYIRAVSNKSLDNKPFRGRKISRAARVSILFCSNSTGTDKRKPLVLSKYKPRRLPADTLNNIDIDCSGKGYMRSDVFSKWLHALNNDMHEQERQIALLIDSAPSHGDSENLGLSNITIIRLLPNTTSLTQPLDAGIIRSFKAHYSQEMLQVISRMTRRSQTVVRTIQNAKLWPCFASSWKKVTPGCIRNCFAKVPIMSRVQADELKELGVEFAHRQVEDLQAELIEKYRHLEDTIASQTDVGVLNYLAMVDCEGPDEATMEAVREIMSADGFKEIFRQDIEIESEDEEETEDEEDDSDIELSDSTFSGEDPDPTLVLRSSNAYARDNSCGSPPSSPLDEEYADILEGDAFLDSLDQLRNTFLALRDGGVSTSTALKRLVETHRSVDATLDYFALTNSQNDMRSDPVMETLELDTESGGLEEEEEEEDALIRTHHHVGM